MKSLTQLLVLSSITIKKSIPPYYHVLRSKMRQKKQTATPHTFWKSPMWFSVQNSQLKIERLTFKIISCSLSILLVHFHVRAVVRGTFRVFKVSWACSFLGGMRITEFCINLIKLKGFNSCCIVIHTTKSWTGSTKLIRAGLISTALS